MSFLRRKKSDDKAPQATPVTSDSFALDEFEDDDDDVLDKVAEKKTKERKNPIQGIRDYIIDSYRGLYKIVLEPSMPSWSFAGLLLFGVLVGLLWGWAIDPPEFTGANPNRLNQDAQDQWIRMAAVSSSDTSIYEKEDAAKLLQMVDNPSAAIERMLQDPNISDGDKAALASLQTTAQTVTNYATTPQNPGILGEIFSWLLPLIIVGVATPIVVVVWRLLFYPNIVAPIRKAIRMATDKEYAEQTRKEQASLDRMKDQKAAQIELEAKLKAEAEAAKASGVTLGPPVMTQVSPFTKGRDYDDSFEIELGPDQGNAFLGQCGALIAEAVAPDPVAVEVWLFDMFSSKNLNKIFIAQQAYNDPSIRSRLEGEVDNPSTDLIAVPATGGELIIESDKLRLKATMNSVQFDGNGRFENFQMQMVAYQKDAAGAPASPAAPTAQIAPAPAMPMSDPLAQPSGLPPTRPQPSEQVQPLQPPPLQMPSTPAHTPVSNPQPLQPPPLQSPPPTGPSGLQPLQPPPLNMPSPFGSDDDEDDDPFGGTGDFTPLNG